MENSIVPREVTQDFIKGKIYCVRGQKVMLDFDLAAIYGYETKNFNRQVKNNIARFPEDFRFQLAIDEVVEISRCKNYTTIMQTKGIKGGRVYLPYAFTEQGVYMLMTVLKGDLAIKQSILIVRTFQAMKNYILENQPLLLKSEVDKLGIRVEQNATSIHEINNKLNVVMDNFMDPSRYKEFLILDGEKIESDAAYSMIYSLANKSIHIIDDYIGLKTLELLKLCKRDVEITVFSDNRSRPKLPLSFVNDFRSDRPDTNISFRKTNGRVHDRYIAIDIPDSFRLFHCGASSKDGGSKITTIMEIEEPIKYKGLFDELMLNEELNLQ